MYSVREISRRLSDQAEAVASMLLPGGRRINGDWAVGDLAGGNGKSLKVSLDGPHAGRWRDWAGAEDEKGDLLDLWRMTRSVTPGEAVKQAKAYLGIVDPVSSRAERTWAKPPMGVSRETQKTDPAYRYLTVDRGISPSTINAFKVETRDFSDLGPCIAFPSYRPDGALVNRSYRSLPKDGKKEVRQDKGCAPSLFGWQAISEDALQNRTILICEGQIDCMTWHQWGVAALSIPNGGGQTWIEYDWDNLAIFDNIYLSFDQDDAGREFLAKTIARLGSHRCLVVTLPEKDANACLLAGFGAEDAATWLRKAEPPQVKNLILAEHIRGRVFQELQPKKEPFTLPFLSISWPHRGLWFRPGEVTVWTGVTSAGKSTFLNYMCVSMAAFDYPIFIASMEVKAETSIRKMIGPFFPNDPVTEALAEKFIKAVGHLLVFADVIGYINQDILFEMLKFSFQRYGITHAVIDSLMRVDGLEEDYPEQGKFLNKLQQFAKSTGVHVHLVAHPRKMSTEDRPSFMDIKGSSLIANNADNIVTISRNLEKEKLRKEGKLKADTAMTMHDTEIIVEKQRETGWVGTFLLKFNSITYSYGRMKRPEEETSKVVKQ